MIINTEDPAVLGVVKTTCSHLAESIPEFHPANTVEEHVNLSNASAAEGSGLA